MLQIDYSLFKHTVHVISSSNPQFGYTTLIQNLRSICMQVLPKNLLHIRQQKGLVQPYLKKIVPFYNFRTGKMSLFYL